MTNLGFTLLFLIYRLKMEIQEVIEIAWIRTQTRLPQKLSSLFVLMTNILGIDPSAGPDDYSPFIPDSTSTYGACRMDVRQTYILEGPPGKLAFALS